MIPLEDKLRAAIHATAEEIPADPPPLRLDSPALSPRRRLWFRPAASRLGEGRFRPGRRGWNTWLAPLAAAVLVVAVVLGSLAVTRSESGTAAPATPATTAGLAGVPPYYVALITLAAKPDQSVRTAAQVRSTATGAVLATIAAPTPNVAFNEITAAADDRTFVLTTQGEDNSPQRLFVLHVDPKAHGVRVSLQALPASFDLAGDSLTDMALSPDGTSLAVESTSVFSTPLPVFKLTVFNVVTWTRRIWSFEMSSGSHYDYVVGVLDGLSWMADGQHVAFTGPGASAGTFALRLLDIRDPGTNALAASKPLPPPAALTKKGGGWMGAIITPDGRTAVYATIRTTRDGPEFKSRQELLKVSVATGKVAAIIGIPKSLAGKALGTEQILYTNATGSVLVVGYAQPGTSAGILRGDTYTPIPWTASTVTAAW